jgi:hypothetical protein
MNDVAFEGYVCRVKEQHDGVWSDWGYVVGSGSSTKPCIYTTAARAFNAGARGWTFRKLEAGSAQVEAQRVKVMIVGERNSDEAHVR